MLLGPRSERVEALPIQQGLDYHVFTTSKLLGTALAPGAARDRLRRALVQGFCAGSVDGRAPGSQQAPLRASAGQKKTRALWERGL
jgi:hypothetical protein